MTSNKERKRMERKRKAEGRSVHTVTLDVDDDKFEEWAQSNGIPLWQLEDKASQARLLQSALMTALHKVFKPQTPTPNKGEDQMIMQRTPRTREEQLARVRRRFNMLAHDLAFRIGPLDAIGTFMGAGVGMLEDVYGHAKTVEYLREVADAARERPRPPT